MSKLWWQSLSFLRLLFWLHKKSNLKYHHYEWCRQFDEYIPDKEHTGEHKMCLVLVIHYLKRNLIQYDVHLWTILHVINAALTCLRRGFRLNWKAMKMGWDAWWECILCQGRRRWLKMQLWILGYYWRSELWTIVIWNVDGYHNLELPHRDNAGEYGH